jgi:hypothetical protein
MEILFGGNAGLFGVTAVIGTLFFLGRTALMLFGGDTDFHHDVGFDAGAGDAGTADLGHHPDSSAAFKILSIQAIAAFLMGFGWGGLGVVRGWGLPFLAGLAVGVVTGSAMTWTLGKLLMWIGRMQSSGTLPFESALYEEGVVYVTIPAARAGRGVVRVVVNDRMQYYPAVTDGDALASQAAVRITAVNEDHTLTVERVTPELPAFGA